MPLTPDEIRQRRFETGRRGYDKAAVEGFRAEVAETVEELSRVVADFEAKLGQLGIDALPDLGEELTRVVAEVGVILEDARLAATEMRRRADEDASRWRADAEQESATVRAAAESDAAGWRQQAEVEAEAIRASSAAEANLERETARRQAQEMRGSAWAGAAAMIERAAADAEALVAEATQDALFIRAGAERDSLRLTGTARQDAEAAIKNARAEADRMMREAEQQSSRLIEEGRRERDEAADEVRRLDQHRIELLVDIEAMQRTFDHMDIELEARRNPHSSTEGEPSPPVWEAEPAVRVVPASRVVAPAPVDADELMAEVARLRQESEPGGPVGAASPVTPRKVDVAEVTGEGPDELEELVAPGSAATPFVSEELDVEGVGAGEVDVAEVGGEDPGDVEAAVADEGDAGGAEPATGATGPVEAEGPGADVIALPVDRLTPPAEPVPVIPSEPVPTLLDDLFARLRHPEVGGQPPPQEEVAAEDATAEPEPMTVAPPEPREATVVSVTAEEAAEMRTRFLLPVENEALRVVKRAIVDLQNRALAAIHDAPERWEVDRPAVEATFSGPVAALVDSAFAAGHAASGELAGAAAPVPVPGTQPLPADDLGADLAGQLDDAHRRALAVAAGPRDAAAAVSRVFRAWRMDETERRLHVVARSAFNQGVLSGSAMLGVAAVATVADARGCADCAARAPGGWDPAGPPPDGWVMPPAHGGCVVSIVPVGPPR